MIYCIIYVCITYLSYMYMYSVLYQGPAHVFHLCASELVTCESPFLLNCAGNDEFTLWLFMIELYELCTCEVFSVLRNGVCLP